MKEIKIGVIGTGHLGKLHTKLLKQVNNCQLIGVYDINNEAANNAAKEFKTKAFGSINDLFDQVDALSIVSTTSSHYELAKTALENGIDVFQQKHQSHFQELS